MKIASFNVENLFSRPVIMNQSSADILDPWKVGKSFLTAYAELNDLISAERYTKTKKAKIVDLIDKVGLKNSDMNKNVVLRQNHGRLIRRLKDGTVEVVAGGRNEWVG